MSDGKGCTCGAWGECECGCPDVDWRSAREVKLEAKAKDQAAEIERLGEMVDKAQAHALESSAKCEKTLLSCMDLKRMNLDDIAKHYCSNCATVASQAAEIERLTYSLSEQTGVGCVAEMRVEQLERNAPSSPMVPAWLPLARRDPLQKW